MLHPTYRSDIDGLRAVAVLCVVAYHAFPNGLTGGFIGVDVFFVISGYLISTILFQNLRDGTFSFAEFYSRRVRRIFPALLLVLAACWILGWFLLLPDEYRQLGKHVAEGAGFVANIAYWRESGYFDTSAETKPLLHLWSLGVEEQFYIAWPLLVWLAWKRRVGIFAVMVAVAIASFALNVSQMRAHAVADFFSPQTRFWELLSGGLLALRTMAGTLPGKPLAWWSESLATAAPRPAAPVAADAATHVTTQAATQAANSTTWSNALSFLGMALLAYACLRLSGAIAYPGLWAAVPVSGTVLVLAAGSGAWLNRELLSSRLLVWFGLISYPLYLWHWPLLCFARIVHGSTPAWPIQLAAVILAVVLSWLTYRLLEKPLRAKDLRRTGVGSLVLLMVSVGYLGYKTYTRDGLGFREVARINSRAAGSGSDGGDENSTVSGCGAADAATSKLFAYCLHDARGPVRYALIGDSKAVALFPGLARTSSASGRWLLIGGNGPSGAPIPLLSDAPSVAGFQRVTAAAVDTIAANPDIKVVAMVATVRTLFRISDGMAEGNLSAYDYKYLDKLEKTGNYRQTVEGLDRVSARLVMAGKRVVLVFDNPALPNPRDCIARTTGIAAIDELLVARNDDCYVPVAVYEEKVTLYRRMLDEVVRRHPGSVEIFETTDLLCERRLGVCGPLRDGRQLYSYTDHISDYAAGKIGAALNSHLRELAALAGSQAAPRTPEASP